MKKLFIFTLILSIYSISSFGNENSKGLICECDFKLLCGKINAYHKNTDILIFQLYEKKVIQNTFFIENDEIIQKIIPYDTFEKDIDEIKWKLYDEKSEIYRFQYTLNRKTLKLDSLLIVQPEKNKPKYIGVQKLYKCSTLRKEKISLEIKKLYLKYKKYLSEKMKDNKI